MMETSRASLADLARRREIDDMQGLPMEPDRDARRELGEAVLEFVDRFVGDRSTSPASFDLPAGALEALSASPPEHGVGIDELLDKIDLTARTGFDTASGKMLSFIPTGALYTAALGSFLGAAVNRYTGGAHASPGAVALEQSVIDWMVELFSLPTGAAGLLVSGGSMATLTAMWPLDPRSGPSSATARCTRRIAVITRSRRPPRIAGIATDRIRMVSTDDRMRLDLSELQTLIDDDIRAGLRPMLVAATAGTTDTGAIDPLGDCAEVAANARAWFHVDAAYGGFFQLTDRGRNCLAGSRWLDSITVDAHKSLLLPFGVGGLLVREPERLVEAHEGAVRTCANITDDGLPHYFSMGPELSRPHRGLPVWLALHLHGVDSFRRTLDRMLDLAEGVGLATRGARDDRAGVSARTVRGCLPVHRGQREDRKDAPGIERQPRGALFLDHDR